MTKQYKTILNRKGYIVIKDKFDDKLINEIKKELTVQPFQKLDFGFKPPKYPVYLENDEKLCLPRYYGLAKLGIPDKTKIYEGETINLKFNGKLKPIQEPVIKIMLEKMNKFNGGILTVGCGFGKTCCSLYIVQILQRKTLVIVHKEFLMNQWKDRIQQFLPDARIGFIQGKKIDIENKDIVIGMLQSISMKDYNKSVFKSFGYTIIDECMTYDTKIITKNGLIKIGKLYDNWKNGDQIDILSYNEEHKLFEYKKMTFAWEKISKKNLVKINIADYIIECTYDHEFLTTNGYVKACELTNEHKMISNNNIYYINYIQKVNCNYSNVYDIEVEDNHNFVLESGLVAHNCHHISSQVFSKALPKIACKYTLGLSATPKRDDRCEKVFHWYLGPTLYSADKKRIEGVQVQLYKYTCDSDKFQSIISNVTGKEILAKMLTNISNIKIRNTFIIKLINQTKEKDPTRKILILSDRLEQLRILQNIINKENKYTNGFYIGGMKEKDLKESEKKEIMFATFSMSSEAMDVPSLDTLIMITPRSNIEQSIGRILRKDSGQYENQPLIIDIIDNLGTFNNQGYKRKRYYKKMNYNMSFYDVINDKITCNKTPIITNDSDEEVCEDDLFESDNESE
jgi:superfamily II DNA or RNA helicase